MTAKSNLTPRGQNLIELARKEFANPSAGAMTKKTKVVVTRVHKSSETFGGNVPPHHPRNRAADEAMNRIWKEWFEFYQRHFRKDGIAISAADQMAFYEIAQPIMRKLATPPDPLLPKQGS